MSKNLVLLLRDKGINEEAWLLLAHEDQRGDHLILFFFSALIFSTYFYEINFATKPRVYSVA